MRKFVIFILSIVMMLGFSCVSAYTPDCYNAEGKDGVLYLSRRCEKKDIPENIAVVAYMTLIKKAFKDVKDPELLKLEEPLKYLAVHGDKLTMKNTISRPIDSKSLPGDLQDYEHFFVVQESDFVKSVFNCFATDSDIFEKAKQAEVGADDFREGVKYIKEFFDFIINNSKEEHIKANFNDRIKQLDSIDFAKNLEDLKKAYSNIEIGENIMLMNKDQMCITKQKTDKKDKSI